MKLLLVPKSIEPFVKDIFLLKNNEKDKANEYPFYADGCPGIISSIYTPKEFQQQLSA
ncbi:MAG: hypothetical protein IH618_02640 [Ignavibacteriaceae bacterium]|nr:hypothetical protein [Ignavibacteriaceae bacterium]